MERRRRHGHWPLWVHGATAVGLVASFSVGYGVTAALYPPDEAGLVVTPMVVVPGWRKRLHAQLNRSEADLRKWVAAQRFVGRPVAEVEQILMASGNEYLIRAEAARDVTLPPIWESRYVVVFLPDAASDHIQIGRFRQYLSPVSFSLHLVLGLNRELRVTHFQIHRVGLGP